MRLILILAIVSVFCLSASKQNNFPDLTKKDDLRDLGIGKIIEKDNSIITKIKLEEIRKYGIVYIKNASLHDFPICQIARIEFINCKWGALKIEFINEKPTVSIL